MRLCNFSNTEYHLNWYGGEWANFKKFIDEQQLDGIELLLHGNYDIKDIPKSMVKGLHLSYFPTWLDFYKGQQDVDYPDDASKIRAFGGVDGRCLHDRFKKEFEIAKALDVEYMVYHVAHVTLKDAFTFEFDYTNEDVLKETINIINDVFVGDGPMLLFENLWWPGLTLLDNKDLTSFMSNIHYKNKGVMLDLSHLMLTSSQLSSEEEGAEYILKVLEELKDEIKWIKGIHINGSNFFEYRKKDHKHLYEAFLAAPEDQKFGIIYQHISSLDQHLPFRSHQLKSILDKVQPDYEMIEVVGSDKDEWENYVKEQLKVMNVL